MMFTHEQLLKAVRKAGRNGETFTCAAVRDGLGLSARDKKQLNRFYAEFRAFQKVAPEVFEKVGKNAYQLTVAPAPVLEIVELPEPVEQELAHEPEQDTLRMIEIEIEIEPEPSQAVEPLEREPSELGFAESALVLESLEMPLQLIEVDFDVDELQQAKPPSESERVEALIREDVPQPPPRGWFGRGLGRRVAEFFGRS